MVFMLYFRYKHFIHTLRANIGKLYILNITLNAFTIVPVLIPFLQSHGLTLNQVFLLQGLYTFSWVVADIPSGYLADVWGRKNTLVMSAAVFCLMGFGYALARDFWGFCLVSILFGVAEGLYSGTIEALTYDTLLALGEERSYRRICGYQAMTGWLSVAIAGILGGFLAGYDLRYAVFAMLPFFGIGLIVSLLLREPERPLQKTSGHFKHLLHIVRETLVENPPLRCIILLFSVTAAMTFSLVWFTQPYQLAVHLPISLFGIANAVFMLGLIAATKSTHYLEKRLDDRSLLLLIASIALASFFLLGLSISMWGLLFIFIGRSTYGALDPLTSDMVNRLTTSDRRATVLSTRTFTYNLIFSVASPLLAFIVGAFTLNQAMLVVGLVGSIALLPVFFLVRRVWEELPLRM